MLVSQNVLDRQRAARQMLMKHRLVLLALLAFFGGSKANASPWVGSTWLTHNRSVSECVDAAQNVLTDHGYRITSSTSSVVFGETNERTILVNCQIPRYAILEGAAIEGSIDNDSGLEALKSNLARALQAVSSAQHAHYIQKPRAQPTPNTSPPSAPSTESGGLAPAYHCPPGQFYRVSKDICVSIGSAKAFVKSSAPLGVK
jgi:hypothetical protein